MHRRRKTEFAEKRVSPMFLLQPFKIVRALTHRIATQLNVMTSEDLQTMY